LHAFFLLWRGEFFQRAIQQMSSFTATQGDPAERSFAAQVGGTAWERAFGGVAAIAFFVSNMIAFVIALCVILYIWGLAALPINSDVALALSWTWWRMASPAIVALAPPIVVWLNYQLRKGWGEKGLGSFNTAVVNVLYFVCTVALAVIAAWLILCAIWYGIEDWVDCAAHTLCSGTTLSSAPVPGAIMIIIAWGLAALLICVEIVLQLYLWYAVRQVITMSVLQHPYAYLAAQIGAARGRSAPNSDDQAEALRRVPLTDEFAAAAIVAHRTGQPMQWTFDERDNNVQPLKYAALSTNDDVGGGIAL
jgi:hypothetical protein